MDLIEYVKSSIDTIVEIKLNEELNKQKKNKDNPNSAKNYETLLQKEEAAIRQHISIEHQLKIQCEKFAEKLDNIEAEKIVLLEQVVIFIIF